MRHRGTLFVGDTDDSITAVIVLDEDRLVLEVAEETWGEWMIPTVSIEEASANRFHVKLGEDTFIFVPDRRLDFAYSAMPAIKRVQEDAQRTWRGRRHAAKRSKMAVKKAAKQDPTSAGKAAPKHAAPPPRPEPVEVSERVSASPPKAYPNRDRPIPTIAPDRAVPAAPATKQPWPHEPEPEVESPANVPAEAESTVEAEAEAEAAATVEAEVEAAATAAAEDAASPSDPWAWRQDDTEHRDPNTDDEVENDQPADEVIIDLRSTSTEPSAVGDEVDDVATNSEVQSEDITTKVDGRNGLRLLERVRKNRTEHVHEYTESSSGVMVRRVCSICNHVSIGSAD